MTSPAWAGGEMHLTTLVTVVRRPVELAMDRKVLPLLRRDARFVLREGRPLQWLVAAAPT